MEVQLLVLVVSACTAGAVGKQTLPEVKSECHNHTAKMEVILATQEPKHQHHSERFVL